jgi:hypothetical protein
LGGIYRREDNRELAEKYWLLRAKGLESIADADTQADAWTDLACMALHYEDSSATQTYLDRFDLLRTQIKGKQVLAVGAIAKGILLSRNQQIEEAREQARKAELLLIDIPHDTRSLFTCAFISELYLNLEEHDSILEICKWAIPEAIQGRHPAYAGHLMLALSKVLCLCGDSVGAVHAFVATEKIPKSVSTTLRSKLNQHRADLIRQVGTDAIRVVESTNSGQNWQELAKSLSQWYNSTWLG